MAEAEKGAVSYELETPFDIPGPTNCECAGQTRTKLAQIPFQLPTNVATGAHLQRRGMTIVLPDAPAMPVE